MGSVKKICSSTSWRLRLLDVGLLFNLANKCSLKSFHFQSRCLGQWYAYVVFSNKGCINFWASLRRVFAEMGPMNLSCMAPELGPPRSRGISQHLGKSGDGLLRRWRGLWPFTWLWKYCRRRIWVGIWLDRGSIPDTPSNVLLITHNTKQYDHTLQHSDIAHSVR